MERFLIGGGIILMKLWLEVSNDEQKKRFEARIDDPVRLNFSVFSHGRVARHPEAPSLSA
jgi:polyphosphate kinase 2 (PPK2 family)